jgi:hypothetical protein
MSSQEAVHVSLIKVTPTSGKGTLVLGGSILSAVAGHTTEISRRNSIPLCSHSPLPLTPISPAPNMAP